MLFKNYNINKNGGAVDKIKEMSSEDIELLWEQLGDIPIDENECIETDFHLWKKGTHREDIWKWFDKQYPDGVVSLMYGHEPKITK